MTTDEKTPEEQLRDIIGEAVGAFGEHYDRDKIVGYLEEFLREALGKPPKEFMPEVEAAAAAYTILEDLARPEVERILVSSKTMHGGILGVPRETAEVFTWALTLGIYLATKGAAVWPVNQETLNS